MDVLVAGGFDEGAWPCELPGVVGEEPLAQGVFFVADGLRAVEVLCFGGFGDVRLDLLGDLGGASGEGLHARFGVDVWSGLLAGEDLSGWDVGDDVGPGWLGVLEGCSSLQAAGADAEGREIDASHDG